MNRYIISSVEVPSSKRCLETPFVVPVHEGGEGGLPGDEAAGLARLPVEGEVGGPSRGEGRHVGTVQLLPCDVQPEDEDGAKMPSCQSLRM